MNEVNRARLARALRWLLSAATLLAAGLLAWQCAALNVGGGFSREAVARALREIAWALWLWLALVAAAAAVGVRTSAGALVPSAEDRLKALLCRAQRTDAARAEETKRRVYLAAFAVAETACAAALWFACPAKEQLPAFAAAWLAVTACAAYVYERAREKSIVREIEELKRARGENAARGGKPAALNACARQRNGACSAGNFQTAAKEGRGVSCKTETMQGMKVLGEVRREKKGAACAVDAAETESAASLNVPVRWMERTFNVEDLAGDGAREESCVSSSDNKTEPVQETRVLGDMGDMKAEATRDEIMSSTPTQTNLPPSQPTPQPAQPRRQPEPPTNDVQAESGVSYSTENVHGTEVLGDVRREKKGAARAADCTEGAAEPVQKTRVLGDIGDMKAEATRDETVQSAAAPNTRPQPTSPPTPPRRQPEPPTAASRAQRICRAAILAAAAALIAWGACNGGMRDVLAKAVNICTECIGLG